MDLFQGNQFFLIPKKIIQYVVYIGVGEANFRSNEIAISNDFSKVEELCQEYLDPDYTYDV
jgi:hypothetical protein